MPTAPCKSPVMGSRSCCWQLAARSVATSRLRRWSARTSITLLSSRQAIPCNSRPSHRRKHVDRAWPTSNVLGRLLSLQQLAEERTRCPESRRHGTRVKRTIRSYNGPTRFHRTSADSTSRGRGDQQEQDRRRADADLADDRLPEREPPRRRLFHRRRRSMATRLLSVREVGTMDVGS